ncbi:hypothetical protein ACFOLK_17270 [Marinococcus halophilus]|uniref:Uncharacterized protein n=2 Tax=Marinococcus halophilus TaxID=1371 RepID=A0A510YAC9_MARHA|nr:hypothetical protein [Marinococcus halophilus]GEK60319.1 hypothetical protein MHA01_32240 [Marinococcus halophilus]
MNLHKRLERMEDRVKYYGKQAVLILTPEELELRSDEIGAETVVIIDDIPAEEETA